MNKIVIAIISLLLLSVVSFSQKVPEGNAAAFDSVAVLEELRQLLSNTDEPESYGFAGIGIGNRLFSSRNPTLNAKQAITNKIIYTPTVAYFHKSGLGLTAAANLLNEGDGLGVNQYSISPSFELNNNKYVDLGISYTHYFVKDKFSPFASPIQQDVFASVAYKKTWIQPGIAIGFAGGDYNDARYKDTVVLGVRRQLYDSVNYKLQVFSITLSAAHRFTWHGVLNNRDGLSITPSLLANAGSGKTTITHKTNANILFNFLRKRGRVPRLQTDAFELQSLGGNIGINYMIDHLVIQPQLYMDYYLPATDSKRFSTIGAVTIAYTF